MSLFAFDRATGTPMWMQPLPISSGYTLAPEIVADPAGGAIIAGGFVGTIDFGGTAPALVSTANGSGYIAGIDDSGVGLWSIQLDASDWASVNGLARSPAGDLAVIGEWSGVGPTLLGTSVPGSSRVVALLDNTHQLKWMQAFGSAAFGSVPSIVTDGTSVVIGCASAGAASVASLTVGGVGWVQAATGAGGKGIEVAALSGADSVLVGVLSLPSGGPDGTSDPPPVVQPTLAFDGVAVDGTTTVIAELAR